jgi:hypothetical protein
VLHLTVSDGLLAQQSVDPVAQCSDADTMTNDLYLT